MYIKKRETATGAKPNAREPEAMSRDGGDHHRSLDGLWTMLSEEGDDTSGLMFPEKYSVTLSRRGQLMKSRQNKLLNYMQSDKEYTIKMANFPGFHDEVKNIQITEEVAYRTMSNSEPCENVICKASITLRREREPTREVTIKFRKAKLEDVTLTEQELRKAALIQDNDVVRAMFPSVYFVFVFTWDDMGQREYWEGVAMESLNPVTREMRESRSFNHDAASILRRIHKEGFMHGDGHSGNFMIRPEVPHRTRSAVAGGSSSAASGARASLSLVPIDFDMLRPLPQPYRSDAEYTRVEEEPVPDETSRMFGRYLKRLATKVMIIYDYNKLLFSNNLHMPFFDQRERDPHMRDAIDKFLLDQCKSNDTAKFLSPSILFMPWPYAFNWEKKPYDWGPPILHTNLERFAPQLLRHINGISVADIDQFYMELFQKTDEREGEEIDMNFQTLNNLNDNIQKQFERWQRQHGP